METAHLARSLHSKKNWGTLLKWISQKLAKSRHFQLLHFSSCQSPSNGQIIKDGINIFSAVLPHSKHKQQRVSVRNEGKYVKCTGIYEIRVREVVRTFRFLLVGLFERLCLKYVFCGYERVKKNSFEFIFLLHQLWLRL